MIYAHQALNVWDSPTGSRSQFCHIAFELWDFGQFFLNVGNKSLRILRDHHLIRPPNNRTKHAQATGTSGEKSAHEKEQSTCYKDGDIFQTISPRQHLPALSFCLRVCVLCACANSHYSLNKRWSWSTSTIKLLLFYSSAKKRFYKMIKWSCAEPKMGRRRTSFHQTICQSVNQYSLWSYKLKIFPKWS